MRPDDLTPFERSDLFGGTGRVQVWNLMGRDPMPPFTAALWCELDPGARVGRHRQQDSSELVIVLQGEGTAEVEGLTIALRPGKAVHLPFGRHLALANGSGTEPLRYLIIKAS